MDLKLWSAWAHRPCVLTDGSGMSQVACATFLCAQYVHIATMREQIEPVAVMASILVRRTSTSFPVGGRLLEENGGVHAAYSE